MAAIAGKKTLFKVSTDGGTTFHTIAGIDSGSHEIDGATIDVSEFGASYVKRVAGLTDGKVTLSGSYRPEDTNGQVALRSALLAGTDVVIQMLPDGGTTANLGTQQDMLVSKFTPDAAVADKIKVSIDLEGNGAITVV